MPKNHADGVGRRQALKALALLVSVGAGGVRGA